MSIVQCAIFTRFIHFLKKRVRKIHVWGADMNWDIPMVP